ncbi:MAG: uL15 family ribosomal protein [Anaeroplasmataceae bacterium]|nr:uL15 family ribosomal protein [Anaeroplasmataceae bacterium]
MLFGRKKNLKQEKIEDEKVIVPEEVKQEPVRVEEPKLENKEELRQPVVEEITKRYVYSFRARLIQSEDENVKDFYYTMLEAFQNYGIKTRESFRQIRCYIGREVLCLLLFKGKKLSVAYALDPKKYEEGKYKIIDASESKRFQNTPVILKLTSTRKIKYALELLKTLAEQHELNFVEKEFKKEPIPSWSFDELLNRKLIKIVYGKGKIGATIEELEDELDDLELEDFDIETEVSSPKRTKKNRRMAIINLDSISKYFQHEEVISLSVLQDKGLISHKYNAVKVLARGTVDKPFTVEADQYSAEAKSKIVAAGGSFKIV